MQVIKINPRYIVSEGYACGKLRSIEREIKLDTKMTINVDSLKKSAKRLIEKLDTKLSSTEASEIGEIHKMILEDPLMWSKIESYAENGEISIKKLLKVRDDIINMLLETGSSLIMERQYDIKDVFNTLIAEISGRRTRKILSPGDVVYLEEVYPSDVIEFYRNKVGAILSRKGSHTSHAAILAMSLEIPYIYNVPDLHQYGNHVIFVDAVYGKLIIDPTPAQSKEIQKTLNNYQKEKRELEKYSKLRFGEVRVMANIGFPQEIELAKKKGADGVGLFRTEFLFLNREKPPSEEKQFLVYKKVLEVFYPDEVIIRLLDIGGDKQVSYVDMPREENPFLGVRGIRFLLKHRDLLVTQLRALLRASKYGKLGILIPMVTNLEDVLSVKKILGDLKKEVQESGKFKLGIMVEVPAVVFSMEKFVPYIDFVSIGTNDLTQYIFAADRNNIEVSRYYNDESDIILSAMELMINNLSKTSIPVAICGELAGKPHMIKHLLRLGIKEFSVTPSKVPRIKKQIYQIYNTQF